MNKPQANDASGLSAAMPIAGYTLFLLTAVNMFNYMDRFALSVLIEPIKADLSLSDSQLGILTGFAFALFYAVAGIPIARWADVGVRRNIIVIALAIWSGMTALCGLAQNFFQLVAARMGVGVGEAGCLPPSHSMIADLYPMEKRSGAMAIHVVGASVGVMIGFAIGGYVADVYGWRTAFFIFGVPGLILAAVVRFTMKEPVRGATDGLAGKVTKSRFRDFFCEVILNRTYRYVIIGNIFSGFLSFGILQWTPAFFIRVHGLSLTEVGIMFGITVGFAGTVGTLAGGLLANRLVLRNQRWPLWIAVIGYGAVLPVFALTFSVGSTAIALGCAVLAIILSGLGNGPTFATAQSAMPPSMRSVAAAVGMFMTSVCGIGLGPTVVGILSDVYASYGMEAGEALRYALITALIASPTSAFFFWISARTIEKDIDRVRALAKV